MSNFRQCYKLLGTQVRFSHSVTENLAERELNTAEFSEKTFHKGFLLCFFWGGEKRITILIMYQTGKVCHCDS